MHAAFCSRLRIWPVLRDPWNGPPKANICAFALGIHPAWMREAAGRDSAVPGKTPVSLPAANGHDDGTSLAMEDIHLPALFLALTVPAIVQIFIDIPIDFRGGQGKNTRTYRFGGAISLCLHCNLSVIPNSQ